jgi:hypothetical protein
VSYSKYERPDEPHLIRTLREKREAAERVKRDYERARDNAAWSYDFLKLHKARVVITVGGVSFESSGDDLDDVITQARLRLYELKQAEADAAAKQRALSWGT